MMRPMRECFGCKPRGIIKPTRSSPPHVPVEAPQQAHHRPLQHPKVLKFWNESSDSSLVDGPDSVPDSCLRGTYANNIGEGGHSSPAARSTSCRDHTHQQLRGKPCPRAGRNRPQWSMWLLARSERPRRGAAGTIPPMADARCGHAYRDRSEYLGLCQRRSSGRQHPGGPATYRERSLVANRSDLGGAHNAPRRGCRYRRSLAMDANPTGPRKFPADHRSTRQCRKPHHPRNLFFCHRRDPGPSRAGAHPATERDARADGGADARTGKVAAADRRADTGPDARRASDG